jgi:hypothetical protein
MTSSGFAGSRCAVGDVLWILMLFRKGSRWPQPCEKYDNGTIEELKAAMREYGLSKKMPEWIETVRIWNAERGRS